LEEIQFDVFEAIDDGGCFAQQFRRMRVGYRQTFHPGAQRASNVFLGILDHDAVGGRKRFSVSTESVERRQRL